MFHWRTYYDNIEYKYLDDGSFELVCHSSDSRVHYKSKKSSDDINYLNNSKNDFYVFGKIPAVKVDLESLVVESRENNQINEFYFDKEKKIFIGKSKKTTGIRISTLIIEQNRQILFPNFEDENTAEFYEEIMKSWKEWCFHEYKKMRVDFYKSQ